MRGVYTSKEITLPKPKHLRGKKSRKVSNANAATRAPSNPPDVTPPKLSAIERILAFARCGEDGHAGAIYSAIIGLEGSITDLSLANFSQMERLEEAVAAALLARFAQTNDQWAIRSTLADVVPGSKVVIDVPKARAALRFYAKAEVNTIMTVLPAPVPLASDPTGFGMAVEARALVFGPNAQAIMQRADIKSRIRGTGSRSATSMVWYQPNDAAALKKELRNMFRPSWIQLPLLEGAQEAAPPDGWNKASARRLRGLVTLMTRSMLPTKKALGFVGEGKSMAVGAITAAEIGMKKACRSSRPPVHPDGLPHFWFDELRRLGLTDVAVPLIKLR